MSQEYIVLVAGPMGAGKTTAIAALSEIPVVRTEARNTDLARHSKALTTVALDYGEITLSGHDKVRLYGVPGQDRFDFMWKILGAGALGVVILIDNSRPDPIADVRHYLNAFSDVVRGYRAVIGVGHTETHPQPGLHEFHEIADSMGLQVPMFSVDVRRRDDVLLLLDVLFHQIEQDIQMERSPTQMEIAR